jgi:predicted HicB family RNase H-like nuclease
MQEQFAYFGGPYKGYCGRAEFDSEAGFFHGEVAGTQDVVTFQAKSIEKLGQAFRESVDDYLAFCETTGKPAGKPFSGKFVTRLDPELHKRVSLAADAEGKSLNQFICDCLERITAGRDVVASRTTANSGCPPVKARAKAVQSSGKKARDRKSATKPKQSGRVERRRQLA